MIPKLTDLGEWGQYVGWGGMVLVILYIAFMVATKAYQRAISPIVKFFERNDLTFARVECIYNDGWPKDKPSVIDRIGKLEAGQSKFSAVIASNTESSSDPIIEFKSGGSLNYANPAALDILGLCIRDAKGHGWLEAVSPIHRQHVKDQIEVAERGYLDVRAHVVLQNATQIKGKDGDAVLISLHPYTDERGNFEGFFGHIEMAKNPPADRI